MFNSQQVGCSDSSERSHLYREKEPVASDIQSCTSAIDDDLFLDLLFPQPEERESHLCPSDSFKILRKYRNRRRKLDPTSSTTSYFIQPKAAMLSTGTIIKLAAEKFISLPPLSHHPLKLPSDEDSKGVQLVQNLLYCAEKVADNQYERALKFLNPVSSRNGTPIQRLVFYFSEALLEKIANETGRIVPKHSIHREDALEVVMFPNMPLQIAFHREFPLAQITKIVGVQAVLDHLSGAKKVHIIDLEIRSGVQWIVLMQALASRNEHFIEHLKITVIGTKWTAMIEETGKQLASFAHSLHLNFSFKIVHVKDIMDLDTTLFDRADDESVSIYASYTLMSIVGRVDRLDHLMAVMRSLRPCAMIVIEIEVNCNSPSFIGRFVESLFFFGAFFDSLADCFKNDETSRVNAESNWFGSSIRNVLTTEGEDRKIRHVDMNVWRAFFARHNLVETELSVSSLDQASMGLHSLPRGSSCTLNMDGKSLILGWNGTPFSSVSAWKFQ
ncbi:hypothetical protein ACS0TY_027672 [Phlomoides rotata]